MFRRLKRIKPTLLFRFVFLHNKETIVRRFVAPDSKQIRLVNIVFEYLKPGNAYSSEVPSTFGHHIRIVFASQVL